MKHTWRLPALLIIYLMQDLMKGAPDTPNVVEACNLEGRQERLDGLLSQLEMCEKALQVSLICPVQAHLVLLLSKLIRSATSLLSHTQAHPCVYALSYQHSCTSVCASGWSLCMSPESCEFVHVT